MDLDLNDACDTLLKDDDEKKRLRSATLADGMIMDGRRYKRKQVKFASCSMYPKIFNSMEDHRLQCDLNSLYLIENFVSKEESAVLIHQILAQKQKWTVLSGRSLQNHGGTVVKGGLIPTNLPNWLDGLINRKISPLFPDSAHPPNHCLINSYLPGEGILPHMDGPLYYPFVVILSLGSPTIIRFYSNIHKEETNEPPPSSSRLLASVFLPPLSLFIFKDDAYTNCLHGIEPVEKEYIGKTVVNIPPGMKVGYTIPRRGGEEVDDSNGREPGQRISLTVRNVKKVYRQFGKLM